MATSQTRQFLSHTASLLGFTAIVAMTYSFFGTKTAVGVGILVAVIFAFESWFERQPKTQGQQMAEYLSWVAALGVIVCWMFDARVPAMILGGVYFALQIPSAISRRIKAIERHEQKKDDPLNLRGG